MTPNMLPELQWLERCRFIPQWLDYIDTDSDRIDNSRSSDLDHRMSHIDSEERPEQYSWDDIRLISTLELRYDEEDDTKRSYRVVDISRPSDIPSHVPHEDSDIQRCRHDDPAECEVDTGSHEHATRACPSEYISEEWDDSEHDDERCPDPEISPWDEP